MGKTTEGGVTRQAVYSVFDGDSRVSIYGDGTVEIQAGGRSYRAAHERWVQCAAFINGDVLMVA